MPLLTVDEVLTGARDEHNSFDVQRHPDGVLLRRLARYQRSLIAKMFEANASAISEKQSTALPLADFNAGIALPERVLVVAVEAVRADDTTIKRPVTILPWESRNLDRVPFPSGYIQGTVVDDAGPPATSTRTDYFFLTQDATRWLDYAQIDIHTLPNPGALTKTSTMRLPQSALDACAKHLAALMAKRTSDTGVVTAADRREAKQDAMDAEEAFLDEIASQRGAEYNVINEVF